jgi:tRNA (guanine37-N1)-methyltransferase
MRIEVVTLFPELVLDAVRAGVLGRAIERDILSVNAATPREFAMDVHRTVDDRPYGGGPGMVMKIEPTRTAVRRAWDRLPPGSRRIYLAADGVTLTQAKAQELSQLPGLLLLAGRYEGIDERLLQSEIDEHISIGDYVLSGGELPALVLIDAVARLLPGVLGDGESAQQDSFVAGLLDWPHYTRPEVFEGRAVPAVLSSGNHAHIAKWRLKEAVARTWQRRPDLIVKNALSKEASAALNEYLASRKARDESD